MIFKVISNSIFLLFLISFYISYKEKKLSKFLISLALAFIFSNLLKFSFRIPRPLGSGYSFPSNHSTLAMASSYYFKFLIPWAILIGLSRIYLGMHRFEDIILGSFLGYFISYTVDHTSFDLKSLLRKTIHISLALFHYLIYLIFGKIILFLIILEILFFPVISERIDILRKIKYYLKYDYESGYYPIGVLTIFLGLLLIFLFEKNILQLILALSIGNFLNSFGNAKILNKKGLEGVILGSLFVFSIFSIFKGDSIYITIPIFFLASIIPRLCNLTIPLFLIIFLK